MPPRHTYWTILFGNQPTAFRSAEREELLPTFKQIQAKHPDAVMRWFARGRLWKSPEEARDTLDRPRYDRPRDDRGPRPESQGRSAKPAGDWRDKPQGDRSRGPKPEWQQRDPRAPRPEWRDKPRSDHPPSDRPKAPAWQSRAPKPPASARWPNKAGYGEASPPASPKSRRDEGGKPRSGEGGQWRDKPQGDRPPSDPRAPRPPAWQNRGPKPEWRDKPQGDRPKPAWQNRAPKPEWRDKPQGDRPPHDSRAPRPPAWQNRGPKPQWRDKPQGDRPPDRPKPAWQDRGPKPPGDRPPSQDPGKRGRDWRPGGAHQDPRDRFKVPRDVKRARFKQNLQRERTGPPRKKKDEE
jgi:hypothetical protein